MKPLSGKKVLLIATSYHNYISIIALAFESLGAYVESYSQDPESIINANFYISRLQKFSIFKSQYERDVICNNEKILNSLKGKQFDHTVIIKGELLTDDFIIKLRDSMPASNFVLYQWDSIQHYNYLNRIKYFNAVFSFDYADCASNKQISYLPLFFSEEYAKIARINEIEYKYDLFFLGINHTNRMQKLLEIVDLCEEKGIKYSVNLMTTISEKIQLTLKKNKICCFFKSLRFDQFSEKYIKSKAILDISSPHQTGLPIRIIEAFGANKKIITTNCNVVNEVFYDPQMIFIWGKDNSNDLVHFLNQKHRRKESNGYSVESFVLNLIKLPR